MRHQGNDLSHCTIHNLYVLLWVILQSISPTIGVSRPPSLQLQHIFSISQFTKSRPLSRRRQAGRLHAGLGI